ncbi:MFS transporter [Schleiferilactobacillus harbinensis]|uniref:MFS transporter n=1 Tax=Schleiferilactobacillus harbinensis TaxID=304207 RepID=A0ABU7T245_9LACO
MNKKKLPLIIGILSMNLLLMSGSAVGSAIAAISKSFSHESISKVQMISSIPQLGQLIATIVFSWLAFKLTRKNLGLLAVAIVAVFGLVPAFYSNSLNMILACMVLIGFGLGLISNIVPILLQEHFEGEERAAVMGWSVGVNNVGMMAFTAIGGVLGGADWRNLFWVYGISVLILLLVFFLVPQDTRVSDSDKQADAKSETGFWSIVKSLSGYVYVIFGVTFIISLAMMTFMANQSILLAGQGKGTAYTAMVTAIGNIGGIATALGLKYIRKITRTDTLAWGFIATALSFVCVAFSGNIVMHVLGNMFSGAGIVMVNATIPYELSVLSNQKQFTVAISMNTFVSSIAGVLAPMILAAVNIGAGFNSFVAGIALSVIVAGLLFVTRLGKRVEKASNLPQAPAGA